MSGPRGATPGDVLRAVAAHVPAAVRDDAAWPEVLGYFDRLSPDLALFTSYVEWPIPSSAAGSGVVGSGVARAGVGALDVDLAVPTTLDGVVRLAVDELMLDAVRPLGAADVRGRRRLGQVLARLAARRPSAPGFPVGVTIAIEDLARGLGAADVGFVFVDYLPEPSADAATLDDALALVGPDVGAGARARMLAAARGFGLGHVGVGVRAEVPRAKAYVVGPLGALVARAAEVAPTALGPHRAALDALARAVGDGRTHAVFDVVGDEVVRVGFELNLPNPSDGSRLAPVRASAAWRDAVAPAADAAIAALGARGPWRAPLDAEPGLYGELDLCHVKVSCAPGGELAWKAYLRLVKRP